MFRPIEGHEYPQVLIVNTEGEYCGGGGHTTEIPSCLDDAEVRKRLLSLLPQGMAKCPEGCHELLVRDEREQAVGIAIYVAPSGHNVRRTLAQGDEPTI